MLWLFVAAVALGLVFNATPGPVFAETVRQGVRGGFRPAFAVQVGSLAGDALWAILGLVGIGLLLQLETLRWPLGVAGVLYLLWLSYDAWRAAQAEFSIRTPDSGAQKKALRAGILLSIMNPQNIAYWAALGSALGSVGVDTPTPDQYAVFFAGFMTASALWAVFCAAVVDRVFRKVGTRWAVWTYRLCALGFLVLAILSARDLFHWRVIGHSAPHPSVQR